jgi:flagellar basal body-associated protein FliL
MLRQRKKGETMKDIMMKNKAEKLCLISKIWMTALVLVVLMVFTSQGYAASTEKSKEDQSKEITLFDPFALKTYKQTENKKNLGIDKPLRNSQIRIPFRPGTRSPFRPTGLNR